MFGISLFQLIVIKMKWLSHINKTQSVNKSSQHHLQFEHNIKLKVDGNQVAQFIIECEFKMIAKVRLIRAIRNVIKVGRTLFKVFRFAKEFQFPVLFRAERKRNVEVTLNLHGHQSAFAVCSVCNLNALAADSKSQSHFIFDVCSSHSENGQSDFSFCLWWMKMMAAQEANEICGKREKPDIDVANQIETLLLSVDSKSEPTNKDDFRVCIESGNFCFSFFLLMEKVWASTHQSDRVRCPSIRRRTRFAAPEVNASRDLGRFGKVQPSYMQAKERRRSESKEWNNARFNDEQTI